METAATHTAGSDEIEVLACNWTTVAVYRRCQLTYQAGMASVVCIGVSATEILAALRLLAVTRREWDVVSAGVQLMGRVAAYAINAAARRAPQKR